MNNPKFPTILHRQQYDAHGEFIKKRRDKLVFYLKINRCVNSTFGYLQNWLNILKEYPDAKAFILCDNPELKKLTGMLIDFGNVSYEYVESERTSDDAKYIVERVITFKKWGKAAFAHLTTFLHAKANGYDNFWNIDADDTQICLEPSIAARLLKDVEDYAKANNIKIFSLDMWRTYKLGLHWSFGVTYTDNSIDWMQFMKEHCLGYAFDYDEVPNDHNLDWYFTYLSRLNIESIETFYVDNLRFIHHIDDLYRNPACGLRYWKNGRLYFSTLSDAAGMGEEGSLPIFSDIIKIDSGITAQDGLRFLQSQMHPELMHKCLNVSQNKLDKLISIIIFVRNASGYVRSCIQSLYEQLFQNFEVIVVDDASADDTLSLFQKHEGVFCGRMKILKNIMPQGKRNAYDIALRNSIGKYILFLDYNDILLPLTLQFLYEVAEQSQSDVVQSVRYFTLPENKTFQKYCKGMEIIPNELTINMEDNSAFIIEDDDELKFNSWMTCLHQDTNYLKIIRRDFLLQNNIIPFDNMIFTSDQFFNFKNLWLSKKYCLTSKFSHIHQRLPMFGNVDEMTNSIKVFTNFLESVKFFKANPQAQSNLLDIFISDYMNRYERVV